jgi:hypothetical protein
VDSERKVGAFGNVRKRWVWGELATEDVRVSRGIRHCGGTAAEGCWAMEGAAVMRSMRWGV